MGKKKSAVCLVLYTLLLAVLCMVCLVSFSYGTDSMHTFNSLLSLTAKDADLGGYYGSGSDYYLGGGYSVVYYPDGVISAEEYEFNVTGYEESIAEYEAQLHDSSLSSIETARLRNKLDELKEEYDEYKEGYVAYGSALYLSVEDVCDGGSVPTDDFKEAFERAVDMMTERYSRLKVDGVRVEVQDEYTVRVVLPQVMKSELLAFTYFSYTGAFSIKLGDDSSTADTIMPKRSTESITKYVKSVSSMTRSGTSYVVIKFTDDGKDIIVDKTADAADDTPTMYFMVGDQAVISLSVSEAVTSGTLYISGSYTSETAGTVAALLSTALDGTEDDLTFTVGDAYQLTAQYGSNALMLLYIAFGVCFVGMAAFFFIRYRLLGFVHLYTYLLFLFATIVCSWAISGVYLCVEAFAAFMIVSAVLSFSNAYCFENARKEYALGKTMTTSVKTGYKKSFWNLFDLHVVLAIVGFIGYFIALTNISVFFFLLGLTALFSGVATLGINRFTWAMMMSLSGSKDRFCNFKREVREDE